MSSAHRIPLHLPRRVGAILATVAAGTALAVAGAPSASAAPAADHSHDPIGAVTATKAVTGGLQFTGWAADPDALTGNVTLIGLVDGRLKSTAVTAVANAKVRTKHHTGPTPGFVLTVPVDTTAPHTVCVGARNVAAGYHTALTCAVTPLGTRQS